MILGWHEVFHWGHDHRTDEEDHEKNSILQVHISGSHIPRDPRDIRLQVAAATLQMIHDDAVTMGLWIKGWSSCSRVQS